MNASSPPPQLPTGDSLDFSTESGAPLVIRVKHNGEQYTLRLTTSVLGIWPTDQTTPDGMPVFNLQAAPVMMITKDAKP